MQWKFFLGACLVTGALLQPHAPLKSIVGGMGLAAILQWTWGYSARRRRHDGADDDALSD